MKNKKNPLLLTAAICLIILATISLGYALLTNFGVIRMGRANMSGMPAMGEGDFSRENFEGQSEQFGNRDGEGTSPGGNAPVGEMPEGNVPEGEIPEGVPSEDFEGGGFREGNMPQGDFQGNFNNAGTFQNINWLILGLYGAALILAVVAGIFIIKGKRWSVFLGVILAIVLAGIDIMTLFNVSNWLQITISSVKLLLGITVIVLVLLPGARKAYAKKNDIFDEEDYALYYGEDSEEGEGLECGIAEEASDEIETELESAADATDLDLEADESDDAESI